MIIAQEKRKGNIAEYILYMWQVEDIIRASHFDIDIIKQNIINQYNQPPGIKHEITEWYFGLMDSMKNEKVMQKGHLQFVKSLLFDLNSLHLRLLQNPNEVHYCKQYNEAKPNIAAFRLKSKDHLASDIECCFSALYAILLMRLQKKEITHETTEAIGTFSKLLASLSQKYKLLEEGLLEI